MLSPHLRARYLASNYEEIWRRLCQGLKIAPDSFLGELLQTQTVIPAGNILAAFGKSANGAIIPIRPNCAILEPLCDTDLDATERAARELWRAGTGVGFNLSTVQDPAATLMRLQEACEETTPIYGRPQRGNMAVVSSLHPRILEFVNTKKTLQRADALHLFNISVSLPTASDAFEITEHGRVLNPLLKEVSAASWSTGCPGIVFEDRLQSTHSDGCGLPRYRTLVPCGEQSMFHGETCALASINLNSDFLWRAEMHREQGVLRDIVHSGVEFLNLVLDNTEFANEITRDATLRWRRIGLGVTGFADACFRFAIPYGSRGCVSFASAIASVLGNEGRARGRDFKNVTVTCLPPTGGLTLLTKNKGFSIEPFFEEAAKVDARSQLMVVDAFQRYICNSVSKTVSLPRTAKIQDVERVYMSACENRALKSVTVYRDMSRAGSQPIPLSKHM